MEYYHYDYDKFMNHMKDLFLLQKKVVNGEDKDIKKVKNR